jgi:hypothetical protein
VKRYTSVVDGNEAAVAVAYRLSEAIAIFPIYAIVPPREVVGSVELREKEYMERLASNRATGIPRIIGGRYGLSSKEFTPAMVKAVFDELKKSQSKNHFTVGIQDDVTHTSLEYDADFSTEDPRTVRALFYGQCTLQPRENPESHIATDAGNHHPQETAVLHHRWICGGARGRPVVLTTSQAPGSNWRIRRTRLG